MDKKSSKKGMGAIIALAAAILVGVVIITVIIAGMIKDSGGLAPKEETKLYSRAEITTTEKSTMINWGGETDSESEGVSQGINIPGSNAQAGEVVTSPSTTRKLEGYDPIAEYEKLTKGGDNILSDHHSNKYIKLVSERYKVDNELLVAIYSEPDTGNNFVLEFSGARDEDGNVIKSPDTLTRVYSIDKNKNIAVATGKTTGNIGVSYAEGTLCFNMIKTIVMPQYPEYFTGVEGQVKNQKFLLVILLQKNFENF